MPALFVLEAQVAGVRARVFVNEVLVFDESAGERKTTQVKLNPWIIEGSNTIRVEAALAGAPTLQVLLLAGEHGREPGADGRLAEFRLDPAAIQLAPTFREIWRRAFTPATSFGRWAWQDSAARPPSSEDVAAITGVMQQAHDALAGRDDAALERLLALKTDELARALGVDPGEYRAGQRSFFRSFFSDTSWQVDRLDPSAWTFVPQAGGRLVTVIRADGGPPLRGAVGDRSFLLPVTLCRSSGTWVIAR